MALTRNLFRLCLLLLTSLFLGACADAGRVAATPTPLAPQLSYEKTLYPVERGALVEEHSINGSIIPLKQEPLFFRASGYVSRVPFKGGDAVKQGDVLAEMQVDDLINQLQQAEIELEASQSNLENRQKAHAYEVARAEHGVKIAEINLEQATTSGGKYQLSLAEENLALAKLSLQQASESSFSAEEQAVKRTQLVVDRLKAQIAERQIVAPFDGVLFSHRLSPGKSVEAFETVITIGDPANLVVRTSRIEKLSDQVNESTEAYLVVLSEKDKTYPLKYLPNFTPITSNSIEAADEQFTNDYFYFEMLEVPQSASAGLAVEVMVVTGRQENALLLPPAAVREFGGLQFVIVSEGEKQRRVEVRIGLEGLDRVEVIGDLQEGDLVVGP